MFDKEEMMKDEYGFYLNHMVDEVPMTFGRIKAITYFITDYVNTRNRVIKKYEAEGKDTSSLVADRDWALYVLGLIDKPEKQAKVIL